MTDFPATLFHLSTAVFMAGNLLGVGLSLRIGETVAGLKDLRFVGWGLFWGFVIAPALSLLLAWMLRLEAPYATGLVLIGLAPCAPFMPVAVQRAKGSLAGASSFLLLATAVTVCFVPLVVPRLVPGVPVDALAIARPLVALLLLPFATGLALRQFSEDLSARLRRFVKGPTTVATLAMLLLCLYLFRTDILAAAGSRSLLALVLLTAALLSVVWFGSIGLSVEQRSVLSLGVGTRNLGVPFAVLSAVPQPDPGSIAVIALAIPVTLIGAAAAAACLAKQKAGRPFPFV
jgi:BASS family bile acid:Na+ symporter